MLAVLACAGMHGCLVLVPGVGGFYVNSRIRLVLFDHCQLRRSAIIKVLHHFGRYRVMLQSQPYAALIGQVATLQADGALVATGAAPEIEHDLIRVACGRRLPVVSYAVQSAPEMPVDARYHVCAHLGEACDADALLLALDHLNTPGCGVCRYPPRCVSARTGRQLSPRGREVFRLLGCGASCKTIAARLELSEKTGYTYTARVRQEMNFCRQRGPAAGGD